MPTRIMGILHIEDGRTPSWWLKLGAASIAVGLGLAWIMVGSSGSSGTSSHLVPAQASRDGCCDSKSERAADFVRPHDKPPGAPIVAAFDPVEAVRRAQIYAGCVALNERDVQGVVSQLEESYLVDPTGAMAAPLIDDEKRLRAQCQRIGPAEYVQIDPLMREAAKHGDLDARYYLLDRQLRRLFERAAAQRTESENDPPIIHQPPAMAREAVAEAEALAMRGHQAAMDLLGSDLLLSGLLAPADPIRAAAWRLVMATLQQSGPLTVDDVIRNGQLVALNSDEAERVVREAQALRDACCGARAP